MMAKTNIRVLRRTTSLVVFTIAAAACQGAVKATDSELVVISAYTADTGQIVQVNNSPTQYTSYIEELAKTTNGSPTFNDQKRSVTYVDGKFVEGPLITTTQQEARDNLMGLEGDRSDIIDRLQGGDKEYYVDKGIAIGANAKANGSVTLQDETEVASRVVLHVGTHDYVREYPGAFVRALYPVPGKQGVVDLGVIVDYCGASSCHSEIEVLSAPLK